MNISKKKVGLGVAVIAAIWILWSVLKPAPAEAAEVGYLNNDFDVNLNHTESTVGFKFKF